MADILEWGWLENRHIIRTILNKAISLWENNHMDEALNLFRNLLKTNPNDNVGARYYILAIRMNMSLENLKKDLIEVVIMIMNYRNGLKEIIKSFQMNLIGGKKLSKTMSR